MYVEEQHRTVSPVTPLSLRASGKTRSSIRVALRRRVIVNDDPGEENSVSDDAWPHRLRNFGLPPLRAAGHISEVPPCPTMDTKPDWKFFERFIASINSGLTVHRRDSLPLYFD